jgi:NADH:ubiquinone oxidoreductase subunit 3 (subunit A)
VFGVLSFNFIVFDLSLLLVFQNIFLLMLLFWLFAWLGEKLFKIKFYNSNFEVYECGFFTFHGFKTELNLTFALIAFLLILYDIEFFFLIPFFFNIMGYTLLSTIIYWIFLVFILLSFLIDWEHIVLDWIG